MEFSVFCPLSGKRCSTACAWYNVEDCNLGNLYHMANTLSDIVGKLEEIEDTVNDLNDTVGSISSSL